jgi:hypothetical protein
MEQDAHLVAVKDKNGAPTGYSKCSLCNAEFGSRPQDPGQLSIIFSVHVRHKHTGRKTKIESISETAARVVNEAMKKFEK